MQAEERAVLHPVLWVPPPHLHRACFCGPSLEHSILTLPSSLRPHLSWMRIRQEPEGHNPAPFQGLLP